jgi:hypothetical protein
MLSRRLVLPALGALALLVSAGAVWKAEAQSLNGVSVHVDSVAPSTVGSGGSATLTVTVTTNKGTVDSVKAQALGVNGVTAGPTAFLQNGGGSQWQGAVKAGNNSTKSTRNVPIRVIVHRTGAAPVNVSIRTNATLSVRGKSPGGRNPNQPPPPPDI